MPTSKHHDSPANDVSETSHVKVEIWFSTNACPVPDDFAVELVGFETWKPNRDSWEARHEFQGLEPEAPYEIRLSPTSPNAEPVSVRFWAAPMRDCDQPFADYLFDIRDDETILTYPGVRTTERRYPRSQKSTVGSQINNFWQRRGFSVIILVVVLTTALLYATSWLFGDETNNQDPQMPALAAQEQVRVTLRASRSEGSQQMLIERENASGGSEQHVLSESTWEATTTLTANRFVSINVRNLSDIGAVRCEILIDDKPWISARSSGSNVSAECEGYPVEFFR